MIQGLLTRPITDEVVRPFVESAKGTLHKDGPEFKGIDLNKPVACFGVLRGTGTVIKKSKEFYYFDHAYYFKEQKHGINSLFADRIYRLTKGLLSLNYLDKLDKIDYNRIKRFKKHIKMKPFKKDGKYILVLPPSAHMKLYYNYKENEWEDNIMNTLKQHTDREVKFRMKTSPIPFIKDLQNAWAVISFQTTAAVDALLEGIPSFCDDISCANPVSFNLKELSEIEKPFYPVNREEWIDSLLANQYTMKELENGFAWNRINETR